MTQVRSELQYKNTPISEAKKFLESMESGPKYQWDWSVPTTDFWQNLTPKDANAIQNIIPPKEVEDMKLDPNLSREEKIEILLPLVQDRLKAKEAEAAPKLFHEADHATWTTFMHSIFTLLQGIGRADECEKYALYLVLVRNPTSPPNVTESAFGHMAIVRIAQGRYKEAEAFSRRALKFVQEYPKCGPDSPMAFGNTRGVIEAVWKQGKHDNAKQLADELRALIAGSRDGKFGKYADVELEALDKMMKELEEWEEE